MDVGVTMRTMMTTIKDRIVLGVAEKTIERPRELQQIAGTNEHHVVHALYAMRNDGLIEFKKKKNVHSPGVNLTKIKLTKKGMDRLEKIK